MILTSDILQTLRDRRLSWGLQALSLFGILTLLVLMYRSYVLGWHPQMAFHSFLYGVLVIITLLNRRLSFVVRAIILLAVVFSIGISGIITWGLASMVMQALSAFCILATRLFGPEIGVWSVSYPDMLLDQLPPDSSLRKPIETIKRSGIKAAAIVQDLLILARRGVATASEVNLNTVVMDYFPMTKEKISEKPAPISIENCLGKGEKILFVVDVEEQRTITAAILSKMGYVVTTLASGEEAIDRLKQSPSDLLVLDIYMDPGMDGLDTYRQALQLHPTQKAIIVSGDTETWRVRAARKLGAGPYLKKPYLMNDIVMAVRGELDRQILC